MIRPRFQSNGVVPSFLTIMLAAIFAIAAFAKMRDLTGFYQVLETSLRIPSVLLWPLAQVLIAAEILIVLALMFRSYRMHGLIGAGVLSSVFLAFSAYRFAKDKTAPCHCFGDLVHLSPLQSCAMCSTMLLSSWYLIVRLHIASKVTTPRESDASLVIGVGGLLIAVAVAGYVGHQPQVTPLTLLNVSPQTVLAGTSDFTGNSQKYTIIMFGDYQCPPCRAASRSIKTLLARNSDSFRFAFRNLPLTSIHAFAKRAAMVAEQARMQREFWPVNAALYAAGDLNESRIAEVCRKFEVRTPGNEAESKVAQDVALAKRLNLNSTPSFVLIGSQGDCWKTDNLTMLLLHL